MIIKVKSVRVGRWKIEVSLPVQVAYWVGYIGLCMVTVLTINNTY